MSEAEIATIVREGLARRRLSRAQLADIARISLSTLEKGLSGQRPFTLATMVRIEEALGVRLRPSAPDGGPQQAAADLGAYRREAVDWLVGVYLTLRPSFDRPDAVYAYLTEINWDDAAGHLVFRETARQDAAFAQKGIVSMPYQSGHIYLVTNEHGQYRLLTLGRPSISGDMYGLLSSLRVERGNRLAPIACPVALLRQGDGLKGEVVYGQVPPGSPAFDHYRAYLTRVSEDGFAVFAS